MSQYSDGVSPLKLLLVEDNDERTQVFERWLRCTRNVPRKFSIVRARSAGAAIGLLRRDGGDVYAGILLDHDLGDQELTQNDGLYNGKDVVNSIIEYVDKNVPMFVHSSNSKEGHKMKERLIAAGFTVERVRFGDLEFEQLMDWLRYACELKE